MNLIYHKNFWDFYKSNTEDVKMILRSTAKFHAAILDPEDMYQELLIRLHKSPFLERYDESQSRLNTFFTSHVRGEALHIVHSIRDRLAWKKEVSLEGIERYYYMKQKMFKDINGTIDDDEEFKDLPELVSPEEFSSEIEIQDLIDYIRTQLPNNLVKVFDLKLLELNGVSIAKALKITSSWVGFQQHKLQRIIRKILKRKGIYVHE